MEHEPEIHEKLGALIARMDAAAAALEAGSRRFRAGERRVASLERALVALAREVDAIGQALRGLAERQDGEAARLASIDEAMVFLKGGWKGAAVVGALLVAVGGLASAASAFLRGLDGPP